MKKMVFAIFISILFISTAKGAITIKFNLLKPNNYEGLTVLRVYEKDTHQEKLLEFSEKSKTFVLEEEFNNVSMQEIACDEHYICHYNVIFNMTNPGYYEINYGYNLNVSNVTVKGFLNSLRDENYSKEFIPTFEVLNHNHEVIMTTGANFEIIKGDYTIHDLDSDKYFNVSFTEDESELIIEELVVDGLKVNKTVNSFCDITNRCYQFTQENNYVLFDEIVSPGNYLINGKTYFVGENMTVYKGKDLNIVSIKLDDDLKEVNNPVLPEDENPLVPEEKTEEEKKDEQTEQEEIALDEDIKELVIDVPNTGVDINEISCYYKKKYYC